MDTEGGVIIRGGTAIVKRVVVGVCVDILLVVG